MTPNDPPGTDCRECGARTCWDTAQDYEAFVTHMRYTSRRYQWRGALEIALAVLCIPLFFGFFFLSSLGPIFVVPGAILFAAYWLATDGASRFRRGRAIRHFR